MREIIVPSLSAIVAIWAVVMVARRAEVRLTLFLAALLIAGLSGNLLTFFATFFREMVNGNFVVPICASLGFAHVVKEVGCDRHLVLLLLRPFRQMKSLLLPVTIVIAFLVNIPVVSQTATAATVGPILLPVLHAAGFPAPVAAAALVLGSSIGGELVNPGGPEYGTIVDTAARQNLPKVERMSLVRKTLLANLAQMLVAGTVFCLLARWFSASSPSKLREEITLPQKPILLLALVPLLPVAILFLTAKPYALIPIPDGFLLSAAEFQDAKLKSAAEHRLIGFAMLIGTIVVGVVGALGGQREKAAKIGQYFFTGAGHAYAEVVSLIVVANCFAQSIQAVGFDQLLDRLAMLIGATFLPVAVLLTFGFAMLCGSGIAATQGLFPLFALSAAQFQIDPVKLGTMTVLGSAAGRTASPVAAVTLYTAKLTGVDSLAIWRLVLIPCLAGLVAGFLVQWGNF